MAARRFPISALALPALILIVIVGMSALFVVVER